ncbi:MAG: segregation and condensation protein B [Sphingobacteriales bacterium]|jgi:segregation and condensation protein B
MTLELNLEALLFSAEKSMGVDELHQILFEQMEDRPLRNEVEKALAMVVRKFKDGEFAFELVNINNGYIFLTRPQFKDVLITRETQNEARKLSSSALETLAIIAYKQPITKGEMENIRGVNCDYSVNKLLDKELISMKGKKDSPGKPVLYGTSEKFMDHFGLDSIRDLPQLKDLRSEINSIGN